MATLKNFNRENCHSEAKGRGTCFSTCALAGFFFFLALTLPGLVAPAAAAEELGRLFLTPQQRQDLDRRRATNRIEEEAPQIKEGPLTLEGHVQRSSGKTATWINGVPQYDNGAGRDPARVTVVPNEGEAGVSLWVGDIYERMSGEVRDNSTAARSRSGNLCLNRAGDCARRRQPPVPTR